MPTPSTEEATATLFTTLGISFVVCIVLLALWHKLIAPAIPAYASRSYEDHVFLASSFVSFYPAVTAPVLATIALLDIPVFDNATIMDARPSNEALHAVGISIGYMLYDTFYCLLHKQVRTSTDANAPSVSNPPGSDTPPARRTWSRRSAAL